MNPLPNDASADQSNVPSGYYRRSNGMVMQIPASQVVMPLKTALRKRTAAETSDAASERLDLAIDAVEQILRDPAARASDKLAAAVFIRDTAHGKPVGTAPQINIGSTGDMQVKVVLVAPGQQTKIIEG